MHRKQLLPLIVALGLALAPGIFGIVAPPSLQAQDETPAGAVTPGLYQSETLPAADTPGRQYALALLGDATATMATDFLNDDAPIEEFGTWMQDDGGNLVVTLTGTVASTYTTPVVITFGVDGTTLTTVPVDPNYGAEGLTLTLAQTESEYLAATGAAETATPTATPAGTYISRPFAAGDAEGLAILHLAADGSALGISITLTAAAPVTEAGTWQENGDGSLTVTLTATLTAGADGATETAARAEPSVTTFQMGAAGELADETRVLYPAASLGDAADVEAAKVPQTLLYLSEVQPAEGTPGRLLSLALSDQGDATLTTDSMNGDAPVVETGSWEELATGEILVALTGTGTETYAEPVEIVFTAADGTLTAAEYDPARFGTGGLTLTLVPNAGGSLEVGEVATMTYRGELAGGEDAAGAGLTMTFGEDGSFAMATDPLDGEPERIELGAWTQGDDGVITVTVTGTDAEAYDTPLQLTVTTQEDGSILAANLDLFGADGTALRLQSTQ